MWSKINNSLLFFSQDFYNQNFYKNTKFIKQLYFYYKNNGYKNIILSHLINILISIFLFFLIILLLNCVNYKALLEIDNYSYITEFVNINNFFNNNILLIFFIISFCVFTFTRIIKLLDLIYSYSTIKKYYNNNLKIKDDELQFIEWDDIINSIEIFNNETLNIYYVNSIILFYDNFFNALINNNIIKFSYLTNLMEWNIYYCILLTKFDKDNDTKNLKETIRFKMRFISIINFIFMPFILMFILFYNIFNYGEEFYNKPILLTSRIFTKNALWKFKYYNELDHHFDKRMTKVMNDCNLYTKQFKNYYFLSISKLIVFICSSFFIVFIILSIINDKVLLYTLVIDNKSLLWVISILATLIAIFKSDKQIGLTPKHYMSNIVKLIHIPNEWCENANSKETLSLFLKLYQYKIITIIKDIIYTILTPFRLWILSNDTESIVNFINEQTINENDINLCKSAYFQDDFFLQGNINEDTCDKTEKSFICFTELYPSWYTYMINKINGLTHEVKVNVI